MYAWAQHKDVRLGSLTRPCMFGLNPRKLGLVALPNLYVWVQSKDVGSSSLANLVCLGSMLSKDIGSDNFFIPMYTWAQRLAELKVCLGYHPTLSSSQRGFK
jgi:hypothetical protein